MNNLQSEYAAFEWDAGNRNKSFTKHGVTNDECEEAFADEHKKIYRDVFHSQQEDRYILIGRTYAARVLYVVFTKRSDRVRVISARDLNKKERRLYEERT